MSPAQTPCPKRVSLGSGTPADVSMPVRRRAMAKASAACTVVHTAWPVSAASSAAAAAAGQRISPIMMTSGSQRMAPAMASA